MDFEILGILGNEIVWTGQGLLCYMIKEKANHLRKRVCPAISTETDHAEFNVADYHVRGVM